MASNVGGVPGGGGGPASIKPETSATGPVKDNIIDKNREKITDDQKAEKLQELANQYCDCISQEHASKLFEQAKTSITDRGFTAESLANISEEDFKKLQSEPSCITLNGDKYVLMLGDKQVIPPKDLTHEQFKKLAPKAVTLFQHQTLDESFTDLNEDRKIQLKLEGKKAFEEYCRLNDITDDTEKERVRRKLEENIVYHFQAQGKGNLAQELGPIQFRATYVDPSESSSSNKISATSSAELKKIQQEKSEQAKTLILNQVDRHGPGSSDV